MLDRTIASNSYIRNPVRHTLLIYVAHSMLGERDAIKWGAITIAPTVTFSRGFNFLAVGYVK